MGRKKIEIEGVQKLPDGRFRIRGEYVEPKTGRRRELDRRIEAKDEIEAASIRATLLDKATSSHVDRKPELIRLSDALDEWRAIKVVTLRRSTRERYDVAIEKWRGAIGSYFVERITPTDVIKVLSGWRDNGRSTETINGRLRVLRTFAKASKYPWIVEGVPAFPKLIDETEANEEEGRGLELDELRALLSSGPTAPLYVANARGKRPKKLPEWWPRAWALVATLAWTGLRFSEASALRWSDIDLEAGILRVRRAQYRGVVDNVKARASYRRVALSPDLVNTLRLHREAMLRGQLPGVASELVFPSRREGGMLVSNTQARKTMLTVCLAAKIELAGRPALHCLRHTMNNIVRQRTSELVRQAMLGHADEAAGAIYSKVSDDELRAVMSNVVLTIIGGSE
jgi:integrase